MANIYDINWKNVGANLMFWRWRRGKLRSYIESIMASIQVLSNKLFTLHAETFEFLLYNGQHKILEELLNNAYDNIQRRIYITENDITPTAQIGLGLTSDVVDLPIEIGLTSDTVPVPIDFALSNEILIGNNFTVNYPASVMIDQVEARSLMDNYVEATKNYNFVIV